jgi:regulator of protease activity HflC (stomatin/prohibitin superfamily)
MKASPLIIIILVNIPMIFGMLTTIPEGHVGIYKVMNQIQPNLVTDFTIYNPLWTSITIVKVVQDTDHVENVKCVSKEGVNINIPDIEIANKIRKDRVIDVIRDYGFDYDKKLVVRPLAQHMRELCAERTVDQIEITDFHLLDDLLKTEIQRQVDSINSGITIDYVRVTTVDVPPQIKEKRLKLAEEKANKVLAEESMKRMEIEKNTQAMIAKRDNDIKLETAKMENERLLRNAEAEKQRRSVENAMLLESTQLAVQKIRLEAEANAHKMELEAKGLRMLYEIPEYASVKKMESIADNTQMIYWGDKLPSTVIQNGMGPFVSSVKN